MSRWLLAVLMCSAAWADNGHYLIDLGSASYPAGSGWNNVTDNTDTTTVYALIDSTGAASTATFQLGVAFTGGIGAGGTTSSTVYPAEATRDYFYGFNTTTGTNALILGGWTMPQPTR